MRIKLRRRNLGNGKTSLYLAVWKSDIKYQVTQGKNKGQWKVGRWEYEFLNLYLDKDKATNKETLKLAESIKAKRQLELQTGKNALKPKSKAKENFVEYFAAIGEKKYPGNTTWKTTLYHLRNFTKGEIAFKSINKEWVDNFKTYLLSKVARNSAAAYFIRLKMGLKMATKEEIIDDDPGKKVKPIKLVEVKKVYLTFDEITRLVKTPCEDEDLKRAFLFGCYTGLRVSDLSRLSWGDIQRDETGYKIEFRQKKTKGFEYLPLSETALKFLNLRGTKKPDEKVFYIPSENLFKRLFDSWSKAAGIKKHIRFHTARHTFATLTLTYGVDLYTVSKLLGHRDIKTTQVYAKVIDQKKRDAVKLLPLLNRQ